MAIIAPSLLASNFLKLGEECEMLNNSAADWFHLDVMDGRFVPNISYGPMIIEFISSATDKFCDVHLMIESPENYVEEFAKAGADSITVHLEACPHLHRNIQQIKNLGIKAGVAINPHTPVSLLQDIISDIDMVLIMSVNPGFGAQSFIPHALEKIKAAKQLISALNIDVKIEVDGGITLANAKQVLDAGADVLVAGNTVFKSSDPNATISALKAL